LPLILRRSALAPRLDHPSPVWIELRPPAAREPLRRDIRVVTSLGGSAADGITVPGLPPGALRLEPLPAGVVCAPVAPGLRIGARPVAPGGRRLLRLGERASFQQVILAVTADEPGDERTRAGAALLLRALARDPGAPVGPHLLVLSGPQAGERATLGDGLVVGRGRGAALRLADAAASRRHARVLSGPGGATVEDLGAKNRLKVNGVAVERGPVPLRSGDLLTIGETELAYQGPASSPAPPPPGAQRRPASTRPPAGARSLVAAALLAASAAALAAIACG
jgi:hypothetical protein